LTIPRYLPFSAYQAGTNIRTSIGNSDVYYYLPTLKLERQQIVIGGYVNDDSPSTTNRPDPTQGEGKLYYVGMEFENRGNSNFDVVYKRDGRRTTVSVPVNDRRTIDYSFASGDKQPKKVRFFAMETASNNFLKINNRNFYDYMPSMKKEKHIITIGENSDDAEISNNDAAKYYVKLEVRNLGKMSIDMVYNDEEGDRKVYPVQRNDVTLIQFTTSKQDQITFQAFESGTNKTLLLDGKAQFTHVPTQDKSWTIVNSYGARWLPARTGNRN